MKLAAAALLLFAVIATGCMSIPLGLHIHVTADGCATDGTCTPPGTSHNYYRASLREIVIRPNQPFKMLAHEACHAHQQQQVIDETGHDIADDSLAEWESTREARDYKALVADTPIPAEWWLSTPTLVERFAEACGRYFAQDPAYPSDPMTDAFFDVRGFRG